ncbi:MAG TPA: hypothetical protein VHZ75_10300 [Solirubrobacteraceae bacterium]|nr:hypothetical protein [Solirubrobacteraceae bacterium]
MRSISLRRQIGAAGVLVVASLAAAVPAFGATTVSESLSNFKITGASSVKAGRVTFRVKNVVGNPHELVVIRTTTRAAKIKIKNGKAVETGKVAEIEVAGHKTKSATVTLKKGHYALICNVGDHFMEGMRKDFTVR